MKRKIKMDLFRMLIFLIGVLLILPGMVLGEDEKPGQSDQVGDVFELGEIVVSADRQVVNLATTVAEVTADDMIARGAQTVADALDMIPGVDIQQGGKNAWVYLRGFDQEDMKVLIWLKFLVLQLM